MNTRETRTGIIVDALRGVVYGGIVSLLLISTAVADSSLIERRNDQFPTDSGYLLAPLPYALPGIGEGIQVVGHFTNVFSTTADPTLLLFAGDVQGVIAHVDEIPLINNYLLAHVELDRINRFQYSSYDSRGMKTGKDDYNLLDISPYEGLSGGLDLTFFSRRLTFTADRYTSKGEITAIRDAEGVIISDLTNPYKFKQYSTRWSAKLDLTDDYHDAHKGVRVNFNYQNNSAKTSNDPDYYVTEINSTIFTPMFRTDTLVFNIFQSDAHVTKKGNTDRATITGELGLNCDPGDTRCQETEANLVDEFVNERRHGTATGIGGDNRLRAFPGGRFNGAHVSSIGAEYRLNLSHDATPFDYYIWKGTHTGIQFAFFAELGTVAETTRDLWNEARFVHGTGVRLVTQSGSVYRADVAFGDEGANLSMWFFYPWN